MIRRKYDIGDELVDMITGFKGVVMAYSRYFSGCIHYGLVDRDSKKNAGEFVWLDQTRLSRCGKQVVIFNFEQDTGGPMPNPPSM